MAGVFCLTALELFQNTAPRPPSSLLLLFAALPLWALLQVLISLTVYPEPTRLGVLATLSYACVVFLASRIPARRVDQVRLALLWFAFVVAVWAMLQSFTAGGKVFWIFPLEHPDPFLMGPIVYHNHWAVFVEIALPLAIYYALHKQKGPIWLYAAMAAALYASVVVAATRSGVLVCTLELIAAPLLIARKQRLHASLTRVLLPLFALLLLGVLVAGPETVLQRLQNDPTLQRADWNRSSLAMLHTRPWQGFGLGNWPLVYPQFARFDSGRFVNQAHNDWLQWAVEGGVLYAALWLAIAAIACRQTWRFPWALGVPAVFCQALVDYPFSRPALAGWVLLVLGMTLASDSKASAPSKTNLAFENYPGSHSGGRAPGLQGAPPAPPS